MYNFLEYIQILNSESNKKDVQSKDNNDVSIKPVTKKVVIKPRQ